MKPGVDTDIITGKPLEQVNANRAAEEQIRDEKILKNNAEFLGLSGSPDGKKLIALVQDHLDRRIDELIATDPKALGFIQILADMGIKEIQATKAAERLVAMKIKQE